MTFVAEADRAGRVRAATNATAAPKSNTTTRGLNAEDRIDDFSITANPPGLSNVVTRQILVLESFKIDTAALGSLGGRRLSGAFFIRAARGDDGFLSVPGPRINKARVSLRIDGAGQISEEKLLFISRQDIPSLGWERALAVSASHLLAPSRARM